MLKTITSQEIKQRLYDLGADLCGIASIDRFDEAPIGFHPRDVLPSCKSVIVFANRFLAGTLSCTIPYTIVRNILSDKMDKVAVEFCIDLERDGVLAIPTGTIGPTEYDKETGRFRNIVSAKHAAQAGRPWCYRKEYTSCNAAVWQYGMVKRDPYRTRIRTR